MNEKTLLEILSKIWNNRTFDDHDNYSTQLQNWIREDLLDEHTHPRLRKSKQERFYLATRKIIESESGSNDEKLMLLHKYIQVYESL